MCIFVCLPSSVSRAGQVWAPEGSTAFKCLLSARFCAALLSNISDCDETFNYWEPVSHDWGPFWQPLSLFLSFFPCSKCPKLSEHCLQMHFLLYGTGMQTWEYSPLYAIRSYAYLWLHALPACLHAHVLQTNKVTLWTGCHYVLWCLFVFLTTDVFLCFYNWLCDRVQQITFVDLFLNAHTAEASVLFVFLSSLRCRCWCSTLCDVS